MKLIESRTFTLERRIEVLEARLQEVEEEKQKWKTAYQQVWKSGTPRSRKDSAATTTPPITDNGHARTPSYLRPTVASKKKAATVIVQADQRIAAIFEANRGLVYDDGKLVAVPGQTTIPNYFRHTEVSAQQANLAYYSNAVPLVTESRPRPRSEDEEIPEERETIDGFFAAPESIDDNGVTCSECEAIWDAASSTADTSLNARSRLTDIQFYSTPPSRCYIPMRVQMRLLRSALRLSQEAAWCALRRHSPENQRHLYLEGPEEVQFGTGDLERAVGTAEFWSDLDARCRFRSSPMGYGSLVTDLRNAVCHPLHRQTKEVDKFIQMAQSLAVALLDERRAFKLRKLRDHVQAEALKAHREIEDLEALATLPYARPWALHHQRLFSSVASIVTKARSDRGEFSPVVIRAAMGWKFKYCKPSELNPDYLRNVEKAKTFVVKTSKGRRASSPSAFGHTIKAQVNGDGQTDSTPPAASSQVTDWGEWTALSAQPTVTTQTESTTEGW